MPRGEKISELIWTRQGRIRFPPAPVPSPTWAQGGARTLRLPLPPDKHQTLLQGTLRMPLLVVWGLPRLGAGSEDISDRLQGPWGLEPQDLHIKSMFR